MPADVKTDYPRTIFLFSVLISVTLIVSSLLFFNLPVTVGLVIGSLVSIIFFTSLWWALDRTLRKKQGSKPKRLAFATKLFIVKFPVLGLVLYFALRYLEINVFALLAGISVTQLAIIFAGLSRLRNRHEKLNDRSR